MNISRIREMINSGENLNKINSLTNRTPLMIAVEKGRADIINLLIERGANVNKRNLNGWTALMVASFSGRLNIVQLLLERGANINARDNEGRTALIFAAGSGHTDIVRFLLDQGANINTQVISEYTKGQTALTKAIQQNKVNTARLLINRGAKINLNNYKYCKSENMRNVFRKAVFRNTNFAKKLPSNVVNKFFR